MDFYAALNDLDTHAPALMIQTPQLAMVIVGNAARHLVINSLDGSPADKESGTNRGRLRDQVLLIGCVRDVGVPASVVVGEGFVEYPGVEPPPGYR